MLSFIIVFEVILIIGSAFLGAISGAIVTVLLKLHAEGLWKDMLLGVFGFEIVQFWPGLGRSILSMLGLATLVSSRMDQSIIAGALVAVTLPALRHVIRFVGLRGARK